MFLCPLSWNSEIENMKFEFLVFSNCGADQRGWWRWRFCYQLHTLKFAFSSLLLETVLRAGTTIAVITNGEGKEGKEKRNPTMNHWLKSHTVPSHILWESHMTPLSCHFILSSTTGQMSKNREEMIIWTAAVSIRHSFLHPIILKQGRLRNQRTTERRKVQLGPNDW